MASIPTGPGSVVPTDAAGLWSRLTNFDSGGATLKPEHTAALDGRVVQLLRGDQDKQAWVQGCAGDAAPETDDPTLADQRAQEMVAYLRGKGIPAAQVTTSPSMKGSGQDAGTRAAEVRIGVAWAAQVDPFGAPLAVAGAAPCWIEIDESAIQPAAREDAQALAFENKGVILSTPAPWHGDVIELDAGAGPKSANVGEDGRVTIEGAASPATPTVSVKRVRQTAQYTVPIDWQLTGPGTSGAGVALGPGKRSLRIQIGGRARLSAWAEPIGNWVENGGLARAKLAPLVGDRGLDDVTFVQTVRLRPGIGDPDDVFWASNFMEALGDNDAVKRDEKCKKWMRDAIQFFHANRIQVFAGYEIIAPDPALLPPPRNKQEEADRPALIRKMTPPFELGKAFLAWLWAKGVDPAAFDGHADKLVRFFEDRDLDIDGISYDLEIDGFGDRYKDRVRALYLAVAKRLEQKERYLAFAGPANSGKNPASMREQPYSLGLDRNILVRPMSYDIGFKIKDGRENMVRYNLERVHLHPSHLQVGVGTDTTSNKITHKDITTECATYHTYRVGLIHWHISKTLADLDKYVDHDKALNPDGPPRGTLGQPMQGPLGPQRIAAFEAAGAAEKARTKPGK